MQIATPLAKDAPPGPKTVNISQWLWFAARLLLSVGLLWLVLRRLSLEDVMQRLAGADGRWLMVSFALFMLITFLSSIRWRKVCKFVSCRLERVEAWRILMISNTFDQLVFNTSGDALRIWWLNRRGPSITHAMCGTLLDRVVGVFALVLLIAAGLPFLIVLGNAGHLALAPSMLVLGGFAGVGVLITFNSLPPPSFPLKANLAILSDASRDLFLRRPGNAREALAAALAVHLCTTLVFAAIGAAIGANVGIVWYLAVIPTVMMLALLPITVGGWGVREGALVMGLGLAGLPAVDALLISVLFGLFSTLVALIGGAVWMLGWPQIEGGTEDRPHGRLKEASDYNIS
jgi:uncharacterized membrane protein YbhN (UPF0104 family)